MNRHRKPPALPSDETSSQLRARLRRFAPATRDEATGAATIPFPEQVTVLAAPRRRNRRLAPWRDRWAAGSARNRRRSDGRG
ncbi:hypothetical protein R69927_07686 [Paraburkholderia domus]|nr:hypothetical protein [Terracidiphilus sp.]CAE6862934.1 hypothetical protein R70006_08180 [Paraburkholderia domus]CAE6940939.1 hypothetical protein R69927_07686 [Paraburkholderia domus]CAE6968534.1 hypothetical protein R75471_07272 [Paraburkholderia domus]